MSAVPFTVTAAIQDSFFINNACAGDTTSACANYYQGAYSFGQIGGSQWLQDQMRYVLEHFLAFSDTSLQVRSTGRTLSLT